MVHNNSYSQITWKQCLCFTQYRRQNPHTRSLGCPFLTCVNVRLSVCSAEMMSASFIVEGLSFPSFPVTLQPFKALMLINGYTNTFPRSWYIHFPEWVQYMAQWRWPPAKPQGLSAVIWLPSEASDLLQRLFEAGEEAALRAGAPFMELWITDREMWSALPSCPSLLMHNPYRRIHPHCFVFCSCHEETERSNNATRVFTGSSNTRLWNISLAFILNSFPTRLKGKNDIKKKSVVPPVNRDLDFWF